MPLVHHATPRSAPRPGSQAERIAAVFDALAFALEASGQIVANLV